MDFTYLWKSAEFTDVTLLIGPDQAVLEDQRMKLHLGLMRIPSRGRGLELSSHMLTDFHLSEQSDGSCSSATSTVTSAALAGHVLSIPAHRVIICTGSGYFKSAISTITAAAAHKTPVGSFHPIIVLPEEDEQAALGVLQFMYTQKVASEHVTVARIMQMLMVGDTFYTFS